MCRQTLQTHWIQKPNSLAGGHACCCAQQHAGRGSPRCMRAQTHCGGAGQAAAVGPASAAAGGAFAVSAAAHGDCCDCAVVAAALTACCCCCPACVAAVAVVLLVLLLHRPLPQAPALQLLLGGVLDHLVGGASAVEHAYVAAAVRLALAVAHLLLLLLPRLLAVSQRPPWPALWCMPALAAAASA